MRVLSNDDVKRVLPVVDLLGELRTAYEDLAQGMNAYTPLSWLYAPTGRDSDYYRLSATTGNSHAGGLAALRIKSDIVSWPRVERENKYAQSPGNFCGLIFLFDSGTGVPQAILQDGLIQHERVGAAAALGFEIMSNPGPVDVGLLGSGGMAESHLRQIARVRDFASVRLYSPSTDNAETLARKMSADLSIPVEVVLSPEHAVRDASLVITATSSIPPVLFGEWLSDGTHVTCVQRRELHSSVYDRADCIVQLGENALPSDVGIPGLTQIRGGLSAFVAGSLDQQARIPKAESGPKRKPFPRLVDLKAGRARGRVDAGDVSLFIPVGTQGVQFAAIAGRVFRECETRELGHVIPEEWFIEQIRN